AVIAPAAAENFLALFGDIGNFKGDVREARPRDFRPLQFFTVLKFENFDCGTIVAVTRQAQMTAARTGGTAGGQCLELDAFMVAFVTDWNAIGHALIKISESLPIVRDEIGVGISNRGTQTRELTTRGTREAREKKGKEVLR